MPASSLPQDPRYTRHWPHLSGVVVADGAAVKVYVKDGQLVINDGIAGERREWVISRVDKDIKRLVILSSSGYITLDAAKWLKDRSIAWSQVTQTGEIRAISGPMTATDARLIRSQAYAPATDAGLEITQYLLGQKLRGHADNLANLLNAESEARYVAGRAGVIESADSIALALTYEGLAASRYWEQWRRYPVTVPFPKADSARVPHHWKVFTDRYSQYSTLVRNRLATDPINAMLNYLYAGIALTECVHACHAVGLNPGLGIFHADKPDRDGMALDLLEAVRPLCERIVLETLAVGVQRKRPEIDRKYFHETTDGVVRLRAPLTHHLAGHAPLIADVLAEHAYHVAKRLALYGDGLIPVARPDSLGRPGISSAIGRPTERLRKGVTVNDVIPDECWEQIRLILPDRKAHARVSACPERDMIAALAVKYLLNTPWSQSIIQPAFRRVAGRYYLRLHQTGTWDQVKSLLEKSGHLPALLSS